MSKKSDYRGFKAFIENRINSDWKMHSFNHYGITLNEICTVERLLLTFKVYCKGFESENSENIIALFKDTIVTIRGILKRKNFMELKEAYENRFQEFYCTLLPLVSKFQEERFSDDSCVLRTRINLNELLKQVPHALSLSDCAYVETYVVDGELLVEVKLDYKRRDTGEKGTHSVSIPIDWDVKELINIKELTNEQ